MDSSTSGSFQSSNGATATAGDNEEYDSRTQSISSFFNPSNHFTSNLNHLLHPPPPSTSSHHHHHHPPPPADTPFFNSGAIWPAGTTNFSPSYPIINPTPSTTDQNPKTNHGSDHHHHHHHHHREIGVNVKNPKKRTRASRRAPTTVLTTDTTNFRQMVQEFTGIPTSPFTTAATPLSRRLDLFRPTAEKVQHPPSFLNPAANIVESSGATISSSYKLHPFNSRELQKQPSSLLDLQNSMLSFQSLLQTSIPQQSSGWREQSEKVDSGFENVARSDHGDQVQGNESSWICPSN